MEKNIFLKKHSGFTLSEILISVAILAILATMGLMSYTTYLKRTRDDRRTADMERIRSALELIRLNTFAHVYPISSGTTVGSSITYINLFLDQIPTDPLTSDGYSYYYWSNGTIYQVC